MSKEEIRRRLRTESNAAGDVAFELEQLKRLQESQAKKQIQGFETITVTCGVVYTIICCN